MPHDSQKLGGSSSQRNRWITAWVLIAAAAFAYPMCIRGLNLSDEGFLLQEVMDILDGKVLYRDIEAFVAPGIWYLCAALFSVLEPSVLVSRILAIIPYVATVGLLFTWVRRTSGLTYGIGTAASFLALSVGAYPSWTSAWYSPWAILFAIAALERVTRWAQTRQSRTLLAAGIYVGLTVLFKQNYGFFALVAVVLAVTAYRIEARVPWSNLAPDFLRLGLPVAAGICTAVVPVILYFASEGALDSIFYRFVIYPTEFTTTARIPYPGLADLLRPDLVTDGAWRLTYMGKVPSQSGIYLLNLVRDFDLLERFFIGMFWLPPAMFGIGLALSVLRPRGEGRLDAELFSVSSLSAVMFLGLFPRADFTHLITIYPPVILLGGILAERCVALLTPGWPRRALATLAVGVAAFYLVFGVAWYWRIYDSQRVPLAMERGGVLVGGIRNYELTEMSRALTENTPPGEPALTVPDLAMINFLSGVNQAGPYYQMYDHMISKDGGAGVVEAAEDAGVRVALVKRDNLFSSPRTLVEYAPVLANWLRTRFRVDHMILNDSLMVLKRRRQPLDDYQRLDITAKCTFPTPEPIPNDGSGIGKGGTPEHQRKLLFDNIRHPLADQDDGREQSTLCTAVVPPESDFVARFGYVRPQASQPGSRLTAEISILKGDGDARAELQVPIERARIGPNPPYLPLRLNLSAYGGQLVTIRLRTRRTGDIERQIFDVHGFAAVWRDPHFEHRVPTIPEP